MSKRAAFDIDTPAMRGIVGSTPTMESLGTYEDAAPVEETPTPVEEITVADEPAKPLDYEADVLPVLHKFLVAKGGRTAADKLLKKYGVDKFSKVPAGELCALLNDLQDEMGVQ
jgi:hypothetical protein